MKIKAIIILLLLIVQSCSNTSVKNEETIIIKGSDTMHQLTEKLADAFMEEVPNIKFNIYGGGTSSGIEELLGGRIDICTASRNLTPTEAKDLAEYYGSIGMYYLIAKDAVSIYVNSESQIDNLTTDQLNDIFRCKLTDFKELNLGSGKIELAIRDSDSGTRQFLQKLLLNNDDFCRSANVFSTTEEILDFIKDNKNGIGFGGLGLAEGIKLVSVNGIEPNVKNSRNDNYPLTRYLHFFTSRSSSGSVKKFIDWVLSPEGQKIIKEEGFIPLWEINY